VIPQGRYQSQECYVRLHEGCRLSFCACRCHADIEDRALREPPAADKRLSDAECAAEYWRAMYDNAETGMAEEWHMAPEIDPYWPGVDMGIPEEVWHRFATHPHAHA
jgi:hypothetical protein